MLENREIGPFDLAFNVSDGVTGGDVSQRNPLFLVNEPPLIKNYRTEQERVTRFRYTAAPVGN